MKVSEFKKQLVTEVRRLLKEEAIRIGRDELMQKIRDTKGEFFTVTFVKKDGTTRTMNARLGVKKYLKGGELRYDASQKGLLPVFDAQKGEYRMINIPTITSANIGNEQYIVA
jgi:hypothetical protein